MSLTHRQQIHSTRYNLDHVIERRGTDSLKWNRFKQDIIPLWVADMDFPSPEPVINALRQRVEHGVFGYGTEPAGLRSAIRDRLLRLYNWEVGLDDFLFLPGTVVGLNLACRAVGDTGDGVLIQTPIYPPFLSVPQNAKRRAAIAPLTLTESGYKIDFHASEKAITPRTRLFLLCNPHNPTGRVFTRGELERLAEICITHDLVICSDEIHQDFVYEGHRHTPIAALGTEVAERTITLLSPSKTYNIAGLHFSVALVTNPELRTRVKAAGAGFVDDPVDILSYVAGLAAYSEGDDWLEQVLAYLHSNRNMVMSYVRENLPGVTAFEPEGTYLAWLDCREAGIGDNPAKFFLEEAKVALSKGDLFGEEGKGFARLNFGCSRIMLQEALEQMKNALVRCTG